VTRRTGWQVNWLATGDGLVSDTGLIYGGGTKGFWERSIRGGQDLSLVSYVRKCTLVSSHC
jgi:hypothetical protein